MTQQEASAGETLVGPSGLSYNELCLKIDQAQQRITEAQSTIVALEEIAAKSEGRTFDQNGAAALTIAVEHLC